MPSPSPSHTPAFTPSPPPLQLQTPPQTGPMTFNTDSPNSPLDKPLNSVSRIIKVVSKKSDRYTKPISQRRGCVEDHIMRRERLVRAVKAGSLEEYMAMETAIKLSCLPKRAKKILLKNNLKMCLREKEWRSL